MIELNAKTANSIIKASKNKAYNYANIVSKNSDGVTEMGRIVLGRTSKERNEAAKVLREMIPDGNGKVFCTLA